MINVINADDTRTIKIIMGQPSSHQNSRQVPCSMSSIAITSSFHSEGEFLSTDICESSSSELSLKEKSMQRDEEKFASSSFSPFALLNDISKALSVTEHISSVVMRVESLVSSGEDVGRPSLLMLPFNSSMLEFHSTSACSPLLLCLSISSMMMCIEAANL